MPRARNTYSASRARRTSRQVNARTVGTHVQREADGAARRPTRHKSRYAAAIARRARLRRIAVAAAAIAIVIGAALVAGLLAFRGTLGGELALEKSDANSALVAAPAGEPSYVLVSAELGAIASPLDNGGPDVMLLVRLDPAKRALAMIAVPPGLQVTYDNRSESVAEISRVGDAALIRAISTFSKVDVSHFVKLGDGAVAGMVDALGGIEVDVDQVIDDPHAGTSYIPAGRQVLDGSQALTYLRADNVAFGSQDRIAHQLKFASSLIEKLFSREGNFATRLESVAPFIQTDYSLAAIEEIDSWLSGVTAGDVTCAVVPGYFAVVTNVTGDKGQRYIGSPSEMAALIDQIKAGEPLTVGALDDTDPVSPGSFIVDIQNGTTVEGAAAAAADFLKSAGFVIGEVGNAEQPVFEETLVVYRDGDDGMARAHTVIDALGVGRAVESSIYYSFPHDVLLILGADNKPVS